MRTYLLKHRDTILPVMERVEKVFKIVSVLTAVISPFVVYLNTNSYFASALFFLILAPFTLIVYFPKYLTSNIFNVSFFVLFSAPIALSSIIIGVLNWLLPQVVSNQFMVFYYIACIPLVSVLIYLFLRRREPTLEDKLKVSLEYNSWIYGFILFVLLFISYDTKDFSKLMPLIKTESFQNVDLSNFRELFSAILQIASYPFLLANGVLKSLVEHSFYRRAIMQDK